MTRLRKQANSFPDWFKPEKYIADGFEALIEVLIKEMGAMPSMQIKEYSPIPECEKCGVDGIGTGPNGEAHTVHASVTGNEDYISNFVAHSCAKYNAHNAHNAQAMTVFTAAKGLHEDVRNKFYMSKVNTIEYAALTKLVDNNLMFWDAFRSQLINP